MKELLKFSVGDVSLRLLTIGLLSLLSVTSGCSVLIVSGGKNMPRFSSADTPKTVRKELGKPDHVMTYLPPISIAAALEDPETRSNRFQQSQGIFGPVGAREDFVFRRWIRTDGPDDGVGFAMWSGCTFGLGEVIAFPAALFYAMDKSLEQHRFRVLYSTDGHYLYHEHFRDTTTQQRRPVGKDNRK